MTLAAFHNGTINQCIAGRGTLVVALDIVYAEPDRLSAGALAATFRNLDPESLKTLEKLPDTKKFYPGPF